MSYDVYLTADVGGNRPATVFTEDWYCISNLAPMWRAAGADLADFDGRLASTCIPKLETAVCEMIKNPDKYEAMNPENGWGDYEGCLDFLRSLLRGFREYPKATVRICR